MDASTELNNSVVMFNKLNQSGPQQVRVRTYANGWCEVQSLSRGEVYFYHSNSSENLPLLSIIHTNHTCTINIFVH